MLHFAFSKNRILSLIRTLPRKSNLMLNSKLYFILQNLSPKEQKRCRKLIGSPYFNTHQGLLELYDILLAHLNDKSDQILSRSSLWKEMYADERPFDDQLMRKYISNLSKLVETFLQQQAYEKHKLLHMVHLLESAADKKLAKLIPIFTKRARKLSKSQNTITASTDVLRHFIHKNHYEAVKHLPKESAKVNFEEMSAYLDAFYIAEKLQIYLIIMSRQYLGRDESQILLIDELVQHLNKHLSLYQEFPAVRIYYQIYLALTESENEEHYFTLKELLEEYGMSFPTEEAFDLYTYAINYCVRKINKGESHFLREYFELHKELLLNRLIFENDRLPVGHYRNLVLVGLRLGELEWTEHFIEEYKQHLPETSRENTYTYNLALLYFYKKKYEQVIKLLRYVEYEDLTFNLNAKVLLIQTYYEMDEIDPLESLMDSFRAYLQRHKEIAARRRRSFNNFIRFVKKLIRVIPRNKKQLESIQRDLDQVELIVNRPWLVKKLKELG